MTCTVIYEEDIRYNIVILTMRRALTYCWYKEAI